MKWTRGHKSANVEDRRHQRGSRIPMPGRGGTQLGCGGVLLLLVLSVVFKTDLFTLLDAGAGGAGTGMSTSPGGSAAPAGADPKEEELKQFVSFVLDETQTYWHQQMSGYRDATLVLFSDATQTACGFGQAATGPFYCPGDQKVYIDLSFYRELSTRFGAPGDFAQAYVLAHEIGHHVQNLTGTERQVRQAQRRNPGEANAYSVAMELQADCYAGLWARSSNRMGQLEPGDIEEGLGAAAAVGDDRIQQMSGRYVNPESWTHGSSKQRMQWFQRGFKSGDPAVCDTFSG